jgi:geranylgeranyl diphosphate synthase, type I
MRPAERYMTAIDDELRRRVPAPPAGPDLLYGMLHYHLGWVDRHFQPASIDAGKRIRPMILLLATEAQGGAWKAALPAAAAVELLHNFTLIHDDIEDRDEIRRGRPTLWALWGLAQAINAGDALYSLSYQSLFALSEQGLPPETVITAAQRYAAAILRITEGQCRDLSFESEPAIEEAAYLTMIEGKTAALLGMACELGSIIAGAPEEQCAALCEFGEALGKAFQMYDDLLGLWGDPQKTGKSAGSDLLKGKKTLPILHGLQHSSALRDLLLNPGFDAAQIPQALAMLESTGSRAHTEARAEGFHREALDALARCAPHSSSSEQAEEAYAALKALAESLLRRQK